MYVECCQKMVLIIPGWSKATVLSIQKEKKPLLD